MEKYIEDLLKNNKGGIQEGVNEVVIKQIKDSMGWQIGNQVNEIVESFMEKELTPIVKGYLDDEKEGMAAAMKVHVKSAIDLAAEAMMEEMKKKLKDSYHRGKLLDAMFK